MMITGFVELVKRNFIRYKWVEYMTTCKKCGRELQSWKRLHCKSTAYGNRQIETVYTYKCVCGNINETKKR